jgi:putative transcriptional regulator
MDKPPYAQIEKGTLLIASPDIDTGIYFRSVILICDHTSQGSFGLILNKIVEINIPEEVSGVKKLSNPNLSFRAGGPLQPQQMMLLHSSSQLAEHSLCICEGVYLGGDVRFLQENLSSTNGPFILLIFGHCGWGTGALEREFLNGEWFIHPSNARLIFETSPEKMWQIVLREMGGKYATLSMIPEDLSLN